jgi:hypothetical protein
MYLPFRILFAIAASGLVASHTSGADLLDNTSQGTGTIAPVQSGGYVTNNFFTAITFSNTTDADIALDNMTIGVFGKTAGEYDIFIELWSVVSGLPDTWVPDMDKQVLDFSIGENETRFLDFDICTFTLPANSSRAIVIWSNAETDELSWQGMSGNAPATGVLGVTYGGSFVSELSMGDWQPVASGVNLSLYLTSVPEPSTYALGIVSVLTICCASGRGRRKVRV